MGFMKDIARAGLSPVGALLMKNKKKPVTPPLQSSMISTAPRERPISMIGSPRGGY